MVDKHPPPLLSHHEHAEVRQVSGHPKHSGLEVFLMAGQVDEGNDLGGLLTDFSPVQASSVTIWFVYHLGPDRQGAELKPHHSDQVLLPNKVEASSAIR